MPDNSSQQITRAILVLTNGLSLESEASESTKRRLDKAAGIYGLKDCIITSTGYTINKKPFLDKNGYPVLESVVSARYLVIKYAIAESSIVAESFSRDTIGNIYIAFQLIILPLKIREVVIVTSAYHLERVKEIVDLVQSAFNYPFSIKFESAEDPNFDKEVMSAMREREKQSIKNVQQLKYKLVSAEQFTQWFYAEHDAYNFIKDPKPVNATIQKAY